MRQCPSNRYASCTAPRTAQQVKRTVRHAAWAAAVMAAGLGSTSRGETLTWDLSDSPAIQTGTGTWDLGATANWTPAGGDGTSRVAWTNGATATFVPAGGTVTVDGAGGQVTADGLVFSGAGPASNLFFIADGAASLQLGAGGISADMTNQIVQTSNSGRSVFLPLVFTASQTWSSNALRTNSNGAAVRALGDVSSLEGTTDLTFDGRGIADPYATSNSSMRVALLLGGTNTFSGTTTVTGGAALWLDYGLVPGSGSKLDDASALILSGGSVVLNAGSNVVETVASTTVHAGGNSIYAGASGGGGTANHLAMGMLHRDLSATLDVTTAVSALASTTRQNVNGILGGWATMGGSSWAVVSDDGSATNITNTSGTNRSTSGTWSTATNLNVSMTASESGIGDQTINALRLANADVALGFAPGATLVLSSGGLIAARAGQSISGGSITTGAVTDGVGELFVHTPNAFTIGSAVVDNGGTPTALVKAGINTLTLTGANTYTGRTYINGGTLTLDDGGSLANANVTMTAGALNGGTTGPGGTLNYRIADGTADLIDLQGGVLDLTHLHLAVLAGGSTPLTGIAEYVLANRSTDSGFVIGSQFATVHLPTADWWIDYDGTALHPDSIVVGVPEPGSVSLIGLAAAGLLWRRRRITRSTE